MKYKVGDFVRVRQWDDMVKEYGINIGGDIVEQDGGYVFLKDMKEFCGKIVQISEVCSNSYHIKDADKWILFCDWMIEKGVGGMTKDDLKDGMVVEDRRRRKFVIKDDKLWTATMNIWSDLTNYADDLRDELISSEDIMKIYQPHDIITPHDFFDENHLALIWERKEVKEMTVEEISKALGYDVKIVK